MICYDYLPNKTFFETFNEYQVMMNETLVRSYFRQLISAIEHLHKNGMAHLDLKLENLMLDSEFQLKVIDFDLSCRKDTPNSVISKGTIHYRAPELLAKDILCVEECDVYSAGILLFTFMSNGILPYMELENSSIGYELAKLLKNNSELFWAKHCKIQSKAANFWSEDFKTLFEAMVNEDPNERATVDEIKQSKWFNGPVYSQKEIKEYMSTHYKK